MFFKIILLIIAILLIGTGIFYDGSAYVKDEVKCRHNGNTLEFCQLYLNKKYGTEIE